jgi:hypothetical protein
MMRLQDLQANFVAGLVFEKSNPSFLAEFKQTNPSVQARFNIYQNNRQTTLMKALNNIYPVCERLVGESFFQGMANHYLKTQNQRNFTLDELGSEFPEFIGHFPPAQSLEYLKDVAELEWIIHNVATAAENSQLDIQQLQEMPQDERSALGFELAENGCLFYSPYPADRIWEINQADAAEDASVDLREGGVYLFIWRKDFDIYLERLSKLEWQLLKYISAGLTLQDLHKMLSSEEAPQAALVLAHCVQKGYITRYTLRD